MLAKRFRAGLVVLAATLLVVGGALGWRAWRTPSPWAGEPHPLYGPTIQELELLIDSKAWSSLKRRPRRFVPARVVHRGVEHPARVRLKGHRSRRKLGEKAAFKLEFPEGEGLEGVRTLLLNNMVEDATFSHEVLAYRFMAELGLAVPRTAYARLRVNGSAPSLYLLVEPLDQEFLSKRGGGDGDVLYEGEYGCDVQEADVDGFDRDGGWDPGRGKLRAFARAASQGAQTLFDPEKSPLDVDAFLRFLAGSVLLGDFDGYRHGHNYYLHFDAAAGKWRLLPWGLDRTFKKPITLEESESYLSRLCLADAACRRQYARTLKEALETFEALKLGRMARKLQEHIAEDVVADTLAPHDAAAVERARARLQAFIRGASRQAARQLSCLDGDGDELDRDGDGHGCRDCDDTNPALHPGATEVCDGVDNDCSGLADDSPACSCKVEVIEGSEFHFCALPMSWPEAQSFCEAKNLGLATIRSSKQSRALYKAAWSIDEQRWWIGYSDRLQEGEFVWSDGSRGRFRYWKRREPNNGSCNEDCAVLAENGRGRWRDIHCNQRRPFICSAPGAPGVAQAPEP